VPAEAGKEKPAMFRLFVGIALPEPVRQTLALITVGLAGARWIEGDALHLTLRFIGEVDGGTAADIDSALSRVTAPGFEMTLSGVDCFAQGNKVHTLWIGVEKEPLLLHLREKVESAIVRSGLAPERRKFKAHITLARFRNGAPERIGSYIQRHSRFTCGPFPVSAFTLYRSHLGNSGPHYEALAEYPLQWGAARSPPA
jgi:2'-5' RNA ligase